MTRTAKRLLTSIAITSLAGCASAPAPTSVSSHFSSSQARQGECMSKHTMFNNRQLMLAPGAVESAWSHCARQAKDWYSGENDGQQQTLSVGWESP